MTKIIRPFMCWRCGYAMDCATHMIKRRSTGPKRGDVAMCLNCGALYTSRGEGQWTSTTGDDLAALSPTQRATLARARAIRPAVVTHNLAGRDKHA